MKAKPSFLVLTLTLAAAAALAAPTPPSAASNPKGAAAPAGPSAPVGNGSKPAALSADQVKMIDDTLSRAESIVKDVEYMRNGDGTGCPASFTVRQYMQDIRAKRISKETGDDLIDDEGGRKEDSGAKIEWQFYYACQAIAQKNPSACVEAGSVTPKTLNRIVNYREGLQNPDQMSEEAALQMQSSQSYEGKCTHAYHRERARAAYISKSPQFMDICKQAVPFMTESRDAAGTEAVCRAWQSTSGDLEPFVQAIMANVAHPLKREFALNAAREMTVAPGACAEQDREYFRKACREQEDFRRALQAKDINQCKGGLCRVLMGDGLVACESYARKFKRSACTQHYASAYVADREKDFKRLADQVDTFLADSDAGIGDPKQMKEINARIDRLYELRDRFDKAADLIAPKAVPRKGAAAPTKGT